MHVPPTEANDAAEPMEGIIIIGCFSVARTFYTYFVYILGHYCSFTEVKLHLSVIFLVRFQ